MELGAWLVHIPDDVSHPCLIRHESCEVRLLGCIVLWEALDFASMMLGALARQETEVAVTWTLKLSVRHADKG